MQALVRRLMPQLARAPVRLALALPGGVRLGAADAEVMLRLSDWSQLATLAAGRIGQVAADAVEGRITIEGGMRPLMAAAAHWMPQSPVHEGLHWGSGALQRLRSRLLHTRERDARQIQFHYDVSDDFYALWLDPRRVYSCAYYAHPDMTLAQAQEAKLDHICRKLMLRPGERFLDIGAGWGGLLLWAAQHYGVQAHGITLSRHQHAWVLRQVARAGLQAQVRVDLMDYRDLDESEGYDKIASVGMFEHVGRAHMDDYFNKVTRLLRPGGLVMNHGITSGALAHTQLGAGLGDFIEKYIFPGGELLHVSQVLQHLARAGLELLDTENLRPHYARTLWAWSDGLESRLPEAHGALAAQHAADRADKILCAYRLYLAGCAMSFERGWTSLYQVLASRPAPGVGAVAWPGAQSVYPFNRGYMYPPPAMIYKFKSKATGDLIMLEPHGRRLLQIMGKEPGLQGIIQPYEMPTAITALEQAIAQDEARRQAQTEQARSQGQEAVLADSVSLRQRAVPMVDMLQRCQKAAVDIVWGV